MKYRESQKDKKLRAWFSADMSKALLHGIKIRKGALRGLTALDIKFEYPISAIAGKNGAGKSTILALACCAFHNEEKSYKAPKRKNCYYTFSDFFVQHSQEVPPQGLEIAYQIAHDGWKPNASFPSGVGLGTQVRKKGKGGKWNDYDSRVSRTVVFLGIERIVPHSERSQSRSYSKTFKETPLKGWEPKVMFAVGQILGRKYDDFRYVEHSKYSLPLVKCGTAVYSGFNMGAGENALFEIFSTVYAAGKGTLLVLDEVELGLHAEAQRRFIDQLKDVCVEMQTQVICTTHSKEIFDCLPSEARYYLESVNSKTRVMQGVSSEFAFAKLSSINGTEADILVEDEVAKALVLASLKAQTRIRVKITVIGSAAALARQLAAIYLRKDDKPVLAVFDGDQKKKHKFNLTHAKSMTEKNNAEFEGWYKSRVAYLPGDTWPELWILQMASSKLVELSAALKCSQDDVSEIIEYGLQAGKHNEFFEIAKHLGLEKDQCMQQFIASATDNSDALATLSDAVEKMLSETA